MIVLYPGKETGVCGQIILNDETEIDIPLRDATDEMIPLCLDETEINHVRLVFSEETVLGEIMVIGRAE